MDIEDKHNLRSRLQLGVSKYSDMQYDSNWILTGLDLCMGMSVFFLELLHGADEAVIDDFVLENIDDLTQLTGTMSETGTGKIVYRLQKSILRLRGVEWRIMN